MTKAGWSKADGGREITSCFHNGMCADRNMAPILYRSSRQVTAMPFAITEKARTVSEITDTGDVAK